MAHNNQTGTVLLPDGRFQHTLSQSVLGDYQKCPEMARAKYMREVGHSHTDSTALGTGLHASVEYALTEKRDGNAIHVDDCIEVGFLELEECRPWKKTKLTEERIQELLPKLFRVWMQDIEPLTAPADIEYVFNVPLWSDDKRDIRLSGTVDLVDEWMEPWDWKFPSRHYEQWQLSRWGMQPSVYLYALAHEWADGSQGNPMPQMFHYAVTAHDGTTDVFTVQRHHEHDEWLRKQAIQFATMIEVGLNPFPMLDAGWHCSPNWCPVFEAGRCKGSVGLTEAWAQIKTKETETRAA